MLGPGRLMQRRASVLSVLARLLWPLQAGIISLSIGGLLAGSEVSPINSTLLFCALGLLRALVGYFAEADLQAAAEAVISATRARIVAIEAKRSDDSTFGGAGSVAALATEKLEMLGPFITRYAPARARVMVLPPVILVLAFWNSWAVGLVLLIAGPLIPVFMALIGLAAKDASARQMAEIGTLNDFLVERMSALVDIRLLGAGDAVLTSFSAQAGNLRRRTMAVLSVAFLSSTVLELFSAIGVAMVAVYVGFSLLGALEFGAWGGSITPVSGMFLLLLAPDFFQPLRDLSAAWHDKAAADAVIDELTVWENSSGRSLPGTGGPAAKLNGNASMVLKGCVAPSGRHLPTIEIVSGEKVALVGESGAGKTTALRLMAGLEFPDQGTVIVAGQILTDANADSWRTRLGWMPQSPHFLSGSLLQNLTLGRKGSLEVALRTANVEKVVSNLPCGLATRLGESGDGLSGGEARRVTLARAMFGDPDILLADEPTADLDAETAQIVVDGLLERAAQGSTLVIATHDPALAARMDRIIDLGSIA